jgi:aryl-alcohol dehydrogenase-like predicted oxidoreductase
MLYRRLGRAGIRLSVLSLGSWVTFHNQVDVNSAAEMMKTAYEAGINFFDNAEAYARGRSERLWGGAETARLAARDTLVSTNSIGDCTKGSTKMI